MGAVTYETSTKHLEAWRQEAKAQQKAYDVGLTGIPSEVLIELLKSANDKLNHPIDNREAKAALLRRYALFDSVWL